MPVSRYFCHSGGVSNGANNGLRSIQNFVRIRPFTGNLGSSSHLNYQDSAINSLLVIIVSLFILSIILFFAPQLIQPFSRYLAIVLAVANLIFTVAVAFAIELQCGHGHLTRTPSTKILLDPEFLSSTSKRSSSLRPKPRKKSIMPKSASSQLSYHTLPPNFEQVIKFCYSTSLPSGIDRAINHDSSSNNYLNSNSISYYVINNNCNLNSATDSSSSAINNCYNNYVADLGRNAKPAACNGATNCCPNDSTFGLRSSRQSASSTISIDSDTNEMPPNYETLTRV